MSPKDDPVALHMSRNATFEDYALSCNRYKMSKPIAIPP